MKKHRKIITLIALFLLLTTALFTVKFFLGGNEDEWICSNGKWQKHGMPSFPMPKTGCGLDNVGISNPASKFCEENGGRLDIKKNKNGEYGICIFDDNRQCEEWAMFNKKCPIKGLKITDYSTEEAKYCVIRGGEYVKDLDTCRFKGGKECKALDYFEGICQEQS